MKILRSFFVLSIVFVIIVLAAAPVLAARGCLPVNGENWVERQEYPQAPGTKINASVAVYYGPGDSIDTRKMNIMVKAWRTDKAFAYSGVRGPFLYGTVAGFRDQLKAIGSFIEGTVLPDFLGLACTEDEPCPEFCQPGFPDFGDECTQDTYFSLKSTSNLIENPEIGPSGGDLAEFEFMFVDLVIAVVD